MPTRPFVQTLWNDLPASWDLIEPPRPQEDTAAGRQEYANKWRALTNAAKEVGWTPADVVNNGGAEGLNVARVTHGMRSWSDRTMSYYAKLIRYSGLLYDRHPTTDAGIALTERHAHALWTPDGWTHPAAWRTAAVARVAWQWPAPASVWITLPDDAVKRVSNQELSITAPDSLGGGRIRLPHGGIEWQNWLNTRVERGLGSRRALCTTEPGPGDHYAGLPLSLRAFQAAFAQHAVACGRPGLSYERYRVAAVANGAPAVGGRGEGARARKLADRPLDPPKAWASASNGRLTGAADRTS